MSRCFPFPPPTYANKGEALDELIKLRKEKEEAKLKRKEHKLLKKLRKERIRNTDTEKIVADGKEKKNGEKYPQEKKRGNDLYGGSLSKAVVEENPQQKKRKNDSNGGNLSKAVVEEKYPQQKKRKTELNGRYLSKAVVEESDQLELSDLTQEHEQPTCSGSVSFVSDSTQSHPKKRRLQESLPTDHDSERKIIRIRLRHSASEVRVLKSSGSDRVLTKTEFGLKPCQELPLATPEGRIERKRPGLIFKHSQELPLALQEVKESKKHEAQKLHLKPSPELPLAGTQENIESKSNEAQKPDLLKPEQELQLAAARKESKKSRRASKTSLFNDGIQSSDQFYGKLLEPWVLPRIEKEYYDFDEDDWLNGSKQENKQDSTLQKPISVVSCSRSSHLWPQASYLPEADIFGLPYTVPF